jgi:general secretion pathway protein C
VLRIEGLWRTAGKKATDRLSLLPVKYVHNVLCAILVLWLLFSLFQIVSTFLVNSFTGENTESINHHAEKPQAAIKSTSTIDILQLQSLNLFGIHDEKSNSGKNVPVQEIIDLEATKTRLNVALEGIVLNSLQEESLAIIVYQGKQDQYYVGEKLPLSGSVSIERVLADHVILNNSGSYESLWLYDEENKSKQPSRPAKKNIPASRSPKKSERATVVRPDASAASLAKDYRKRLYENPRSLAEAIRISPSQKNGELVGYKVSPGKDTQQFINLGFKPNDVVTSINGIALDEPSKALEIYKLMRSATEANFSVDRGGETVDIAVSLGDNNNS